MNQPGNVDPRAYRDTIGFFATGVTIICSGKGADTHAMTANAITSLSLDPVMLILCVAKAARMAAHIQRYESFTVSILDAEQEALANYFAGFGDEANPPEFSFVDWHDNVRVDGCLAALCCELHTLHDGGDHWIAVGRVIDLYRPPGTGASPLIYYLGRYETTGARPDATL